MNEPIRILQVFSQMNRGGAEIMIMNLYRNIDREKVQFDFMVHTEEEGVFDKEIKLYGGHIYYVPWYTGENHFQYKKAWRAFFKAHHEYKIIHGHVRSTAAIYLKIANEFKIITIAHSHNTSSGKGFSAIAKYILQYPIRYTADYLFACSNFAGYWLFGKKACHKDNYFVLKNAINTKIFTYNENIRDQKRDEWHVSDNYVIGHVGRFHSQKNHDFLIDVFKTIHDQCNKAVLLLVGEGHLKNSIEKKVAELGLKECVIFAGLRSDIPEILQAMDVFLFPSLFEGLPVTLIEAQAAGLPCVVSDKITDEVKITKDLVSFVSLNESFEQWGAIVLKAADNFERKDRQIEIEKSGYDIVTTTQWMQAFYLKA